jgi:hypothetical protein
LPRSRFNITCSRRTCSRQGFEISLATQSVWCGDVADLVEQLYQLMAERVRASHMVSTDDTIMPMQSAGKTISATMWVPADCDVLYRILGVGNAGTVVISAFSTDDDRDPGTPQRFAESRWKLDSRKRTLTRAAPRKKK